MAADLTSYCLENITDYLGFEQFCNDVMARVGYPNIEPLGGFADCGRDAVFVSNSGSTTIFAYSVRENWRAKLAEDAAKIARHGHQCDSLVFVTTSRLTAGRRDEAKDTIRREYGWSLELYGLERLRILLDDKCASLKQSYPQIFPPDILAVADAKKTRRSHLLISYGESDKALATWLARKLTLLGYEIWCRDLPRISSEVYPVDVESAIRERTYGVIALYSSLSLTSPDLARLRHLALEALRYSDDNRFIPVLVDNFDLSNLDTRTRLLRS